MLLVTHSYPPRPSPASRRPFGLAKYLRRLGYRVIVLTSDAWGDSSATEPEGDLIQARDLIGSRLNWRQRNISAYEGRAGRLVQRPAERVRAHARPRRRRRHLAPLRARPGARPSRRGRRGHHHLRPGVDPPGRAWRCAGAACPGSPTSATAGASSPIASSRSRSRSGSTPSWSARVLSQADRVTAVSEPIAADLRDRLGLRAISVPNGYDDEERARRRDPRTRSPPIATRSSTRAGSPPAGARPTR